MTKTHSEAFRVALLVALLVDIIVSSVTSTNPSSQISFGTWNNMPNSSVCSVSDTSKPSCELMGNQSYRGLMRTFAPVFAQAGYFVGLSVSCINPSNTVGESLQLQYANGSRILNKNVSKFVNIGSPIKIDNSANNPCPGNLSAASAQLPPINVFNNVIFIFRVVGYAGGGTGDNPRFSDISVIVNQQFISLIQFLPASVSTTGFTANLDNAFVSSTTTVVTFDWIATNTTNITPLDVESGTGSCTIAIKAVQCTQVITFPTAFIGTPNVVGSPLSGVNLNYVIFTGTINLLKAQTLTV